MTEERARGRAGGPPAATQRGLELAFSKLLSACVGRAYALGAKQPYLYFESEGGLVVLDGPPHDEHERPRQNAVLFSLPWPRGTRPDVGAW